MENLEYVVIIGFVFLVFVILLGVSIYFIQKGKMKADTWHLRSLGLPRGSVRARGGDGACREEGGREKARGGEGEKEGGRLEPANPVRRR